MKVKLTYFKPGTGTYYASGEYETSLEHMFEIFNEVQDKWNNRGLPGLVEGHSGFITLIDVPDHPHNYPHLIGLFHQQIQGMVHIRGLGWAAPEVADKIKSRHVELIESDK